MPGLFGIISKKRVESSNHDVETMLSSMKYENFYKSGIYSNTEMSIFVGWTCFPGSPYENLPIINKEKNVFLFLLENYTMTNKDLYLTQLSIGLTSQNLSFNHMRNMVIRL